MVAEEGSTGHGTLAPLCRPVIEGQCGLQAAKNGAESLRLNAVAASPRSICCRRALQV